LIELLTATGLSVIVLLAIGQVDVSRVRLSPEILSQVAEVYRKIRNTWRFCLANVSDFNPAEAVPAENVIGQLVRKKMRAAPTTRGGARGGVSGGPSVSGPPTVTCHVLAEMDDEVVVGSATSVDVTLAREVIQAARAVTASGTASVEAGRKLTLEVVPKKNFVSAGDTRIDVELPEPGSPVLRGHGTLGGFGDRCRGATVIGYRAKPGSASGGDRFINRRPIAFAGTRSGQGAFATWSAG